MRQTRMTSRLMIALGSAVALVLGAFAGGAGQATPAPATQPAGATAAQVLAGPPAHPAPPVPILFDTDMDSDCDDAGAIAVLHALADRGEARILATVTSSQNPYSAPCLEAFNTYYGRPDLPVGAPKGKAPARPSAYTRGVAEAFPHKLKTTEDAPDALDVYRRVLAAAPDHSVVVVTVGFMTNLAALLKLPADASYPAGIELVGRKVRFWACMGGNFLGRPARDDLKLGNTNFVVDAEATRYALEHFPRPVIFVGREIGSAPSGLKAGAKLAQTPESNPVRLAYKLYFKGEVKDRHVADPTTVLFAVRGLQDYWEVHATGHMDLQPDMRFEWKEGPAGPQAYLLKRLNQGQPNDRYVERVCEELMIQPPRWTPARPTGNLPVPQSRPVSAPE